MKTKKAETTAFVATIGGHIRELVELAKRIPADGPTVWITNDSPQTRDLLADRDTIFVPFVAERDVAGVLRSTLDARRLYQVNGVGRVISTGSAIALGYLPVAAALGIEAHYIESSTRIRNPSVTGRLLARTPGVRCWWQYGDTPPRFQRGAGVYDRYRSVEQDGPTSIRRMVVTVGTTDRDFRRLIERLTTIVPTGTDVLWQTGASDVTGLGIDGRPMVPASELAAAVAEADVVVSHAGTGSLALALDAGHAPLFIPRRSTYDEQIDDHQIELADWAAEAGLAISVEADQIEYHHLEAAARKRIMTSPVGELVLQ